MRLERAPPSSDWIGISRSTASVGITVADSLQRITGFACIFFTPLSNTLSHYLLRARGERIEEPASPLPGGRTGSEQVITGH